MKEKVEKENFPKESLAFHSTLFQIFEKFEKMAEGTKIFSTFKVEKFSSVRGSATAALISLRRGRPRTDSPDIT